MKDTILALSLLATSVSAQQVTAAPNLLFKQAQAVNLAEDGAEACEDANRYILACSDELGGIDGIENSTPDQVLACACCDGGQAVWDDYAVCSSEMEEGSMSTDAYIYGDLATVCSQLGSCSGGASGTASSSVPTKTSASVDEESLTTTTSSEEESAAVTPGASASECDLMFNMYLSCIDKTPDFANLGFRSQAECYCCSASRGQTSGTLTWTDEIDQYASTCWDWAEASATDTEWDYASSFATYCDNFSDVCEGMAATAASAETTAETSEDEGPVTVTVTNGQNQETETGEPDAAVGLQAGSIGGLVGVVAGLLML